MERLPRVLLVVLLGLTVTRGLMGCNSGPSSSDLCSAAREKIISAKSARNEAMTLAAQAKDLGTSGSGYDAEAARQRQKVDEATREARAIPDCSISDLVGENVGR